jgi:hypothetical protein
MKKLLAVSILLTLLTAAAFAQLGVSVYGDFYPDLMKITAPTGLASDANEKDRAAFPGYLGNGTFDLLSSSNMTKSDNEVRLELKFTDPKEKKYEGFLQLKADAFFKRDGGFYEGVSAGAITTKDLLTQLIIGDFYLKGSVGMITGYVGNTANRGVTNDGRFNIFNNFVDKWNMGNLGILLPSAADITYDDDGDPDTPEIPTGYYTAGLNALDVNNLRRSVKFTSTPSNLDLTYVSFTMDLSPIKIDIAGDLGNLPSNVGQPNTASYTNAGGAFRISGSNIGPVNFDAIYKIYGTDGDTDNKANPDDQPNGEGLWNNAFGLYANLNLIEALGITVGYSGYVRTQEDKKNSSGDITKHIYPYFSGVDLRFQFTGVDKLTLAFNNNISFSGITNDSDDKTNIHPIAPYTAASNISADDPQRASEVSEGYFGMFNALAIKYMISDALAASFQVGNKLGTLNHTDNSVEGSEKKQDYVIDQLFVTAGAEYSLGSNVLLGAGLALNVNSYSFKATNSESLEWGTLTFGIPLRVKVKF